MNEQRYNIAMIEAIKSWASVEKEKRFSTYTRKMLVDLWLLDCERCATAAGMLAWQRSNPLDVRRREGAK